MKRLLILALCLLGMAAPAYAYMPQDLALLMPGPFEHWKTLETEHFRINYQQDQLAFAQRVAAVAEKVYARLTPQLGWIPKDKTEVVINDSYDGSNGGATVLPYDQFFIFMNAPVQGELLDDAPWIEQVFSHEFVHILHLDQATGIPENLRHIFGRIFFTFPQIFSPAWVSEGLAVYGETDAKKGFGRGQGALYDAMMRAEYMHGLRSFSQLSYQGYWGTDWPSNQVYLYGYYFFEFLNTQYGHDKAMAYVKDWNDNIIPWRMDSRAKDVFGIGAVALWKQYQDYLTKKFSAEMTRFPEQKETPIVDSGRVNSDPVWLANGDFYFYRNDGRTRPSIEKIDAKGVESKVADVVQFNALAVHPKSGVLISRNAICDNTKAYSDLYRLEKGSWHRITHCGRYPRIAWSHNGKRIAAVHVHDGLNQIAILDGRGELLQLLKALPLGDAIGKIAWSPDDGKIVAAVRREKTGWDIEQLNLNNDQWQALTNNPYLEQQPQFSADGQAVYFLSDQDKAINLRRLNLADGTVQTLTHTQTAVMQYAVNEKAKQIRIAEYTAKGIMIRQVPLKIGKPDYAGMWQNRPEIQSIVNGPNYNPKQYTNITNYNPLDTMAPQSWLALLYADSSNNTALQVLVDGQDVLGYHHWQLAPKFYFSQSQMGGSAAYIAYHRLALLVDSSVKVRQEAQPGVPQVWDTENRYQAVWLQPFNSFDGTFQINTGMGTEDVTRKQQYYGQIADFHDNFAGVALSWADYDLYLHSISVENGRSIKLNLEKYDALGGAYHSGNAATLDWREYISLFHSNVLALRAVAGHADPTAKPYELGDELDQFESLGGNIGFGKTGYTLRGYHSGAPQLTGSNLRLFSAEWRMPLIELFNGFNTVPIGIGKSSMLLFVDHGAAWYNGVKHDYYTGVGAEIHPDILVGYSTFKLDSTIGVAKGLDKNIGDTMVYLRVGASF